MTSMTPVEAVALLSIAVLTVLAVRAAVSTFKRSARRLDQVLEDALEDIDVRRWEEEASQ